MDPFYRQLSDDFGTELRIYFAGTDSITLSETRYLVEVLLDVPGLVHEPALLAVAAARLGHIVSLWE